MGSIKRGGGDCGDGGGGGGGGCGEEESSSRGERGQKLWDQGSQDPNFLQLWFAVPIEDKKKHF